MLAAVIDRNMAAVGELLVLLFVAIRLNARAGKNLGFFRKSEKVLRFLRFLKS